MTLVAEWGKGEEVVVEEGESEFEEGEGAKWAAKHEACEMCRQWRQEEAAAGESSANRRQREVSSGKWKREGKDATETYLRRRVRRRSRNRDGSSLRPWSSSSLGPLPRERAPRFWVGDGPEG